MLGSCWIYCTEDREERDAAHAAHAVPGETWAELRKLAEDLGERRDTALSEIWGDGGDQGGV